MAFPLPPSYTTPIPNDPFYWPQDWVIDGPYNPLIVGAGLYVGADGTIVSTGGGPAVAQVLAGPGIAVTSPTGIVTVSNTGVLSLVAGTGISLSAATGNVTVSSTAAGTVTGIVTGYGLTGGPITTTGQIDLSDSGVSAGTYSNPTITVDAKGRVTSATGGTSVQDVIGVFPINVSGTTSKVISVAPATTATAGTVQLSDSVSSAISNQAATPLAVKTAYDAAILGVSKSCYTAKGTIVSGASPSVPVALPVGVDGQFLVACSTTVSGLKWIDSIECVGTVTQINTGLGLTGGPITTTGTLALDPSFIVQPSEYLAKGSILAATAPGSPSNVSVGADGTVLMADSVDPLGVAWTAITQCQGTVTQVDAGVGLLGGSIVNTGTLSLDPTCVIPPTVLTAKGDILTATAPGAPTALPVGANGQVLVADSFSTEGLSWATLTQCQGTVTDVTAGTGLLGGTVTTSGTFTLDSTCVIPPPTLTAKGDLLAATGPSAPTALAAGTDGQYLVSCAACTAGLTWVTPPISPFTIPAYATFFSAATQINSLPNSYVAVTFDSVSSANDFSVVSGSRITAAVDGVYNLQVSLQVTKSDTGTDTFEYWVAKNGINIPGSNRVLNMDSNNSAEVASFSIVEPMVAGDYVEIRWYSLDTAMQLTAYPAVPEVVGVSPARPLTPSAMVSISQVGA